MTTFDTAVFVLAAISIFAAFVNGALGYGFSSLTVPVALVFYTGRVLNPAIVIMEIFLNLYVLFINRAGIPSIWKRVMPILIGLLPGILLGGYLLASVQPTWIKLVTYCLILPVILLQAAGWRRSMNASWQIGLPFGSALGFLYSLTTISGPPLAVLFNNQGYVKGEFRAGLALVRTVESIVTAILYYRLGLFVSEIQSVLPILLMGVIIGVPTGAYFIRHLNAETFRRICMSFDAWVVGFGLSRVLIELHLIDSPWAYLAMVATMVIDCYLLYQFFTKRNTQAISMPASHQQ
jgi:uncharacterized protein